MSQRISCCDSPGKCLSHCIFESCYAGSACQLKYLLSRVFHGGSKNRNALGCLAHGEGHGGGHGGGHGETEVAGAATVPLDIQASLTDVDASEVLGVTVSGLPDGASLSAGTDQGDGSWLLGGSDLDDLTMNLPEGYDESFQLNIEATATEIETGESATTSAVIDVGYGGVIAGDDTLYGGGGDDTIYGGGGEDELYGQGGADTLYGEAGDDDLSGGGGADTLYGGAGDDRLEGGGGADTLYGDAGDDDLSGGGGSDTLYGGAGDDRLEGGGGADTLVGGAGEDILAGGGGRDTFVFNGESGVDTVVDYHKGEVLRFEGGGFDPDSISVAQNGDGGAVITFGGQEVEVTVNDVNLSSMSYSVTQEPDAVVVTFEETD